MDRIDMSPNVRCERCGKAFRVKATFVGKTKYCSRRCCRSFNAATFWTRFKTVGECLVWTGGTGSKRFASHALCYGVATGPDGAKHLTHRIAWELRHGPIPNGMQVLHHCDNPPCARDDHLFLGTHIDNINDKVRKRRHCFGSKVKVSKFKEEDILKIRMDLSNGKSGNSIASEYGVVSSTIHNIAHRITWKHV